MEAQFVIVRKPGDAGRGGTLRSGKKRVGRILNGDIIARTQGRCHFGLFAASRPLRLGGWRTKGKGGDVGGNTNFQRNTTRATRPPV